MFVPCADAYENLNETFQTQHKTHNRLDFRGHAHPVCARVAAEKETQSNAQMLTFSTLMSNAENDAEHDAQRVHQLQRFIDARRTLSSTAVLTSNRGQRRVRKSAAR